MNYKDHPAFIAFKAQGDAKASQPETKPEEQKQEEVKSEENSSQGVN